MLSASLPKVKLMRPRFKRSGQFLCEPLRLLWFKVLRRGQIVLPTFLLTCGSLIGQTTIAQTADSKASIKADAVALEQQLKALQEQTAELEARIKALESATGTVTSETTAPTPDAVKATPAAGTDASSTLPAELHELRGIQWKGFGEVDYKVLDQRAPELGTYGFVPGSAGNFYSGDFDLFLYSHLNDKTSVLADIAFEETDAQQYKIDPRQLLLKYDCNDHLQMSFGRYQTGIGYYNWAFRSASWLQTTADRPLVMEYASNGGLLPTQAIGVAATGSIPSGRLGLNYFAQYGSADTMRPDLNGDGLVNDENNGNYVAAGFFLQPDAVPGLRVGGSIYHDQISDLVLTTAVLPPPSSDAPAPDARWNQTIVNGHVVYISRGVEFLSEGFLIRHSLIHGDVLFDTPAFYSQLSRRWSHVRPFVRYQYVNASSQNSVYSDLGLRHGPSFGARYDFNEFVAFKAQLDHTFRRSEPDLNGLQLQIAFAF